MAKPSGRRKLALDENVIAAHETLEDAAQKVGKAANVLMRRIEELSADLDELRERHATDTRTAEARYQNDIAAADKAHEREVATIRADRARVENELARRIVTLEGDKAKLEEKLRKVQATLA